MLVQIRAFSPWQNIRASQIGPYDAATLESVGNLDQYALCPIGDMFKVWSQSQLPPLSIVILQAVKVRARVLMNTVVSFQVTFCLPNAFCQLGRHTQLPPMRMAPVRFHMGNTEVQVDSFYVRENGNHVLSLVFTCSNLSGCHRYVSIV